MIPFFNFLWISFFICAIASLFIFFAKKFSIFLAGVFLFLTGVSLQFIATDIFSKGHDGRFIAISVLLIFIFELILFSISKKKIASKKTTSIFYLLPFLAFLTIGLSTDLLTFLLGLTLFSLAFLILAQTKDKAETQKSFLRINIALLAYTYGMSILFSREATIAFAPLHLKLSLGNLDAWTSLGVGLLSISIIIELYGIIPLLGKTKK